MAVPVAIWCIPSALSFLVYGDRVHWEQERGEGTVTRVKLAVLKNLMMFGNFVSNLIGVLVVNLIGHRSISPLPIEMQISLLALTERIDRWFLPLSFVLVGTLTVLYEQPIRRVLQRALQPADVPAADDLEARRRLLNEPFVLIALDLGIWLCSAIVYPLIYRRQFPDFAAGGEIFIRTMMVGLVTSVAAFFILEHTMQKQLVPRLFPDGGLFMTPGTIRIRIATRIAVLVFACNIIPAIAVLRSVWTSHLSGLNAGRNLDLLRAALVVDALLFIAVGIFLGIVVTINLTRPLGEIIQVLRAIRRGRLDRKVRVTSNDEIGYTGDVINDMTDGLRERERMQHALALAREVQQSLLPRHPVRRPGVDIAGTSTYCDQTGGDYFDFIDMGAAPAGRLALVVGDVSGHGIPSALIMATVRASLRLRCHLPGSLSQIVGDVNRQLARDMEDSGRFMTLFFLEIDPARRRLRWVRAGHDAALFYDPRDDTVTELSGRGIALGAVDEWRYDHYEKAVSGAGQIVVLATDGIWEARNSAGEMFGKSRLHQIIRANRDNTAAGIVDAVVEAVEAFRQGRGPEDDVTMVVARFTP